MGVDLSLIRSALFLPASNPRAIEKARTLPCDMAILDLEDAVRDDEKDMARAAAVAALSLDWGGRIVAIRVNAVGCDGHDADLAALAEARPVLAVAPKVESAEDAYTIVARLGGVPILAMIETVAGVYAAREIAAVPGVRGLIAGTNDLAAALRLSSEAGRIGLGLSLQAILLAARAAGGIALDGVYNRLDDMAGLEAQCVEGRALGFDGKSLIHPSQIEACNRLFGPSAAEIEEAEAMIAAATGGAERFRGRMIEAMHVDAARRLLARARA